MTTDLRTTYRTALYTTNGRIALGAIVAGTTMIVGPTVTRRARARLRHRRGQIACPHGHGIVTTIHGVPDAILAVRSADHDGACIVDYTCTCGVTHRYWFDESDDQEAHGPGYLGDVSYPGALPAIPMTDLEASDE